MAANLAQTIAPATIQASQAEMEDEFDFNNSVGRNSFGEKTLEKPPA